MGNDYKEMIKGLTEKQLRKLVVDMAEASDKSRNVLLDFLTGKKVKNNELDKAVERRMREAEGRFEDIWDDACIVLDAMEDGDWEELTERGFKDYYFEDANIDDQIEELKSILEKEKLSEGFRRKMMEQMVEVISGSDYCGDEELDLVEMLCYTDEDMLEFVDLLQEYGAYNSNKRIARILKEVGTEEDYLDYLEDEIRHPENAIALYKDKLAKNKQDEAETVLWKGFELSPHSREISSILIGIAEERADIEVVQRMLDIMEQNIRSDDMETCDSLYSLIKKLDSKEEMGRLTLMAFKGAVEKSEITHWFKLCQEELSSSAYEDHEEAILKKYKQRCPADYYCYLIDRGETQEALDVLKSAKIVCSKYSFDEYVDTGHRISRKLADKYPEDIYEIYWKEADVYGGNKDYYRRCALVLSEIKELAEKIGWKEDFAIRFAEFVEARKRRRYLITELKKEGLL